MESLDCCVIGAGIIGLAVARKFAMQGHEVVVLEAEKNIGTHTSSRNSGVIHGGIYYSPTSIKAQTCVAGNRLLYAYCEEKNIAYKKCGKLIVATETSQQNILKALKIQAEACGVTDLRLLSKREARSLEPGLQVEAALLSPSTGIIDVQGFLLALQADLESQSGTLIKSAAVEKISIIKNNKYIELKDNFKVKCNIVINAAGHQAIPLAAALQETLSPAAPKHSGLKTIPSQFFAKGNYFSFSGGGGKPEGNNRPFSHLIYPVPEKGGLGIHLTFDTHGYVRFGPDVEWVSSESDLGVNEERVALFYRQIRQYWPGLPDNSLLPDYAGIRPKIVSPLDSNMGAGAQDFIVHDASVHGVNGLIHLFGIESPGLTSSLALADRVYDLLFGIGIT